MQALDGDRVVPVPAGRVRALLAVLLLHANRVVTVDELVEQLWTHERPPANPKAALQTSVRRLRQAIGQPLVRTSAQGYRIELDPTQLDLTNFRRLARQATLAEGPSERVRLLSEALALWCGQPLVELGREPWTHQLVEERLHAHEQLVDAKLAFGQHAEVVAELTGLTSEHPLRERCWAQLMLALHGCGRQADALDAYRRVSRLLADQLGIDPGEELRRAHKAVLAGPAEPAPAQPVPAGPAWVAQCQLPLDVGDFVGRADAIDELVRLLAARDAVPVITVSGPPGAGKTALAVRVAHRLRASFPDGQWYVRLDGAGGSQRDPADVLADLLRTSGVDGAAIPDGLDERAAALRARLADRRVLLVLDDAGSAEQVRPLLPGVTGSAALVTSRQQLPALAVFEGGRAIHLGGLDADEAGALLARILGARAVHGDQAVLDEVDELARLCGWLPLALRIAAANLAVLPGRSIGDYVAELRSGDRLAKLTVTGEPQVAVRAAFDLSYTSLDAEPRRLFRLLGAIPGPDVTAGAAAALLACSRDRAEQLLDELAAANLVQRHAAERYALHDLLRLYAAELATSDPEREPAWRRLCQWYLATAHDAVRFDYAVLIGLPAPPYAGTRFGDGERAKSWLDAERANLVAAAARAADAGPAEFAWQITDALRRYMYDCGHLSQWRVAVASGLRAAEREGDPLAEGAMHHALGLLHDYLADYPESVHRYQVALERYRAAGFSLGEAGLLCNLALVHDGLGEPRLAADLLHRCSTLLRELGREDLLGPVLTTLSAVRIAHGQLHEAIGCASAAVAIELLHGRRTTALTALLNRAEAHRLLGEHDQALADVTEAGAVARELEHKNDTCAVHIGLTLLLKDLRRFETAAEHGGHALRIARDEADGWQHAHCLNALGELRLARGAPRAAAEHHRQAIELAEANGYHALRADGLAGMAAALHHARELDTALDHARHALKLARERELRIVECRALLVAAALSHDVGERDDAARFADQAHQIQIETGYVPPREISMPAAR